MQCCSECRSLLCTRDKDCPTCATCGRRGHLYCYSNESVSLDMDVAEIPEENTMPIAVQVSVSPVLVKSIEALKQECDWLRAAKDAAVRDAKACMNLYIERVAEPPPPPRPSPDKILTVLVVLGAVLILSLPVLEALHVFRF